VGVHGAVRPHVGMHPVLQDPMWACTVL